MHDNKRSFLIQNNTLMKTSLFLTVFCLIFLSGFIICSKIARNMNLNHNTSISISEAIDAYRFTAVYDVSKTREVQQYINRSIEPNGLFKSENDYFDATTTLNDRTEFHIKESPGNLKIELDRKKNSYPSYLRIKNMCKGINAVLTRKN